MKEGIAERFTSSRPAQAVITTNLNQKHVWLSTTVKQFHLP